MELSPDGKTKLVSEQREGKASDSILVLRDGLEFPQWCSRDRKHPQYLLLRWWEPVVFMGYFPTGHGQLKVGIAGFCQLRSWSWGFVLFTVNYFIYIIIMYIIYKRLGGFWQIFWTTKVIKVTTYIAEWSYGISTFYHCSSAPFTCSLRAVLVSLSKQNQIWWACGLLWLTHKLVDKPIKSANISWWRRRRTHGCLTPWRWQSLRDAATKWIQTSRQALTSWQLVQVTSFPGPMIDWAILDLGNQSLAHVCVLWSENFCTIPNIYPVELIHLWVCIIELCISLLGVFQPSFSSFIIYRLNHYIMTRSLSVRKCFFSTGRFTKNWNRLPREVAELPSLEAFKKWVAVACRAMV